MRRRARRAPAGDPLCGALAELLSGWSDASGHLRAAKRELLLFVKELAERELARMDGAETLGARPATAGGPKARRSVRVRRSPHSQGKIRSDGRR